MDARQAFGVVQATWCATLVDEWVAQGLAHAVVSPGSRSTPMALALAARDEIRVHVVLDERSAGFVALGIGEATGRAAAVLCTSGTAAVHLHAAVVEADLAGVPLLVLTADRPPELHHVGAPQTIDQTRLYGPAARLYHDPGVADASVAGTWRAVAARSLAATGAPHPGPVHLNLAFRDPLVATAGELPARRGASDRAPVTWPAALAADPADVARLARVVDAQRGVIVAGRGAGSPEAVGRLSDAAGWPVLADPRSGCGHLPGAVRAFDSILRHHEFAAAHAPQVVVRLGDPPASKVLAEWAVASGAVQVHVGARPRVVDPEHAVTHRVVGDPAAVCAVLAAELRGASGTPWLARWRRAEQLAEAALAAALADEAELTEPGAARTVLQALPEGAHLVVSSSMPVRDVEWFAGSRAGVTTHANRGANGIDGVVATAIGIALGTRGPVGLLIGDVAFVHDSSSLAALARRDADVRIVVVDNDGGGIFSFLPQATELASDRFEQLFGTPHGTDVPGLAAAHGLPTCTAGSTADLAAAVAVPGPHVVRVRTDRQANKAVHDALHRAVHDALGGALG